MFPRWTCGLRLIHGAPTPGPAVRRMQRELAPGRCGDGDRDDGAPTDDDRAQIVARMRQIGFARILYGSDGPEWSGVPPRQHWEEFRKCMPLTRDEVAAIATNIAPYLR